MDKGSTCDFDFGSLVRSNLWLIRSLVHSPVLCAELHRRSELGLVVRAANNRARSPLKETTANEFLGALGRTQPLPRSSFPGHRRCFYRSSVHPAPAR